MPDYRRHLNQLVTSLIALMLLFLLTQVVGWQELGKAVWLAAMTILLAILILARFGGGLEPIA